MSESGVTPRVLQVEGRAIEWIKGAWSDGLSLARTVSARLGAANWDVFAVTGEASRELLQAHDFRYGGLPPANCFAGLAVELARRFEGDYLIVELALARPVDSMQLPAGAKTVTCDSEVYEVIRIGSDQHALEGTLRATDPASVYNCFVAACAGDLSFCPSTLFEDGVISMRAAITGAYDGEGFVFAIMR